MYLKMPSFVFDDQSSFGLSKLWENCPFENGFKIC